MAEQGPSVRRNSSWVGLMVSRNSILAAATLGAILSLALAMTWFAPHFAIIADNWSATALLVHLGALTYVAGFLVRDQMILRSLILIGTGLYIAYYYLEPATPLWDAILWSVILGFANAYTMLQIVLDRRPGQAAMSDPVIRRTLRGIPAAEARKIIALSVRNEVRDDEVLMTPGRTPEHVFLILSGMTLQRLHHAGQTVSRCGAAHFVGSAPFLLGQSVQSTVTVKAGGGFLRWRSADLRWLAHNDHAAYAAFVGMLRRHRSPCSICD